MEKTLLTENYTIDKSSYIPIYVQLKDIIKELINTKTVRPNEKIPSENELAAAFNISRMTVRQAIQELNQEGYTYIKRGEGTFVKSMPHTHMLFRLEGFSAEMSRLGYRTSSSVVKAEKISYIKTYKSAYNGLREMTGNPITLLKRVRFLEDVPFAVESSYLPFRTGEGLLSRGVEQEISIYKYLENECNVKLLKAEHVVEPSLADKETAKLLHIKEGSPVLLVKGTTFDRNGNPAEYIEGIYRGDKYEFKVEITKSE